MTGRGRATRPLVGVAARAPETPVRGWTTLARAEAPAESKPSPGTSPADEFEIESGFTPPRTHRGDPAVLVGFASGRLDSGLRFDESTADRVAVALTRPWVTASGTGTWNLDSRLRRDERGRLIPDGRFRRRRPPDRGGCV